MSAGERRQVRIRLFAGARERAGREFVSLELPGGSTIADARRALGVEVPELAEQVPYLLFAVGTDYCREGDGIPSDSDLVAFPPVSGG